MLPLEIGISEITYNEDGSARGAMFQPTLSIEPSADLLNQLRKVVGATVEEIKENASLVFGSWFNETEKILDLIETADREKFFVDVEVLECKNFEGTSIIQKCKVKYTFKERA